MIRIEEIAAEALAHHSLQVRSLLQEFLREGVVLADIPQPQTQNEEILALSAALLELFGVRSNQRAPAWTAHIGAVQQPIFLVEAASRMPRLRTLCEQEAPEPLRKRRIYAPPNYLELA
jgi:hypothetical protein